MVFVTNDKHIITNDILTGWFREKTKEFLLLYKKKNYDLEVVVASSERPIIYYLFHVLH
jgi:hypothetical protein